MKIAYLHQYFNTPFMSGGTRSYEMARRLVAYGHDVEVISSWRQPSKGDLWFLTEEDGIKVHWLPVPYSNHMGFADRLKAFVQFAWAAKERTTAIRPDLVFATSTPLTIAIPGVRAAKSLDVPLVFEVRDLWPEIPIAMGDIRNPLLIWLANWLERYAYFNSQEIVALSPGMFDGVARTGFPADRIHTIPNSADIELFANPAGSIVDVLPDAPDIGERKLIVYCGTFGRVNKVGYLSEVAAAALTIDPSLLFFAIGDGAEYNSVRDDAERRGVLGRNFFMFPPVQKHQVPVIMKYCQLSLSLVAPVPALWNNSANKFFDSLAAGRAIGINYLGWHADIVRDENIGVVFSSADAAIAARQISEFTADAVRVREAGKRALRLACEKYDRDKLAQQLHQVLVRSRENYRPRQSSFPSV